MARAFELWRQHDLDRPFLWFPWPDRSANWLREVMLVRNRAAGAISMYRGRLDRVPVDFEEVL